MATDLSLTEPIPDKSAPAANINGLPVTAIATASDFCAVSIAEESELRDAGPNVFGRL